MKEGTVGTLLSRRRTTESAAAWRAGSRWAHNTEGFVRAVAGQGSRASSAPLRNRGRDFAFVLIFFWLSIPPQMRVYQDGWKTEQPRPKK